MIICFNLSHLHISTEFEFKLDDCDEHLSAKALGILLIEISS